MIIKETVREYFVKMFSEDDYNRPSFNSTRFKRLSEEEKHTIEIPFSEDEVWRAISRCGSSKASGPNGFNFRFIKRYCDVLNGEIMRALDWFWEYESINNGCNVSFVSLISKVSNPISLGEFRPISLIGCFYKILAKVLAERIKKVIGGDRRRTKCFCGRDIDFRWSVSSK